MGSAALLLNRFITAVHRTCCRTVHRPRREHRTAGRLCALPAGQQELPRAPHIPPRQTVHQCAQLALCLEQLALLIYDQSLSLALFGQVQRSVLAFFGIFQTHFLDLVEIHKRHLSYYRPVYRGPCADVISIIAHRPLVCNERTAFFTVWCRFGNNFFAFGLNSHDNFTHRHSVPCGRLRRHRIPAACCPPAAAPAPAVPHAQSGGLSHPTARHCGLPA